MERIKSSLIFLFLLLAALSLHCCARAFSSCGVLGHSPVAACGLLVAVAPLVAERNTGCRLRGLCSCGAVAQLLLGVWNLSEPGRGPWPCFGKHILFFFFNFVLFLNFT